MSSDPRWAPDGTELPVPWGESAVEQTDPLLPVITDDMLPPLEPPTVPTLDDRTLARLLAELDGEDTPPGAAAFRATPAGSPATALPVARSSPEPPSRARSSPEPPSRARSSPAAHPAPALPRPSGRYVRRDQPPPPAADALSLTGLTRRCGGRVGSILFTVIFVAIFLLILVQAIVSLLTAGR
ncbi:MAG: hypothetical protein M3Z25_13465 [Actinomycetota bacterium]|nr:hypothetical protein [Actinomycetota bacterium]